MGVGGVRALLLSLHSLDQADKEEENQGDGPVGKSTYYYIGLRPEF